MLKEALDSGSFVVQKECRAQAQELAAAEIAAGKPLTDMSKDELIKILSRSESYWIVYRKILVGREYIVWLLGSGIPVNQRIFNSIKIIDVDISDEVRKLYFPEFCALLPRLSKCVPGSFVPAVVALLWLGVPLIKIPDISEADICFSPGKMTVILDSMTVETNDYAIITTVNNYIRCDSKELISRAGLSTFFALTTDGHLLKRLAYKSEGKEYIPYSMSYVRRQLQKAGITSTYITDSGEFQRLYQKGKDAWNDTSLDYYYRLTFMTWKKVFCEE